MRTAICLAICLLFTACSIIQGTRVEQAVLDALAKDTRTAQYEFNVVRQDDGSVVITGKLFSPAEIDVVTQIAKGVKGVDKVINNCGVEEPGSNMMQDDYVNTPFLQ
jgi:osmotically-inducible protein OsmY